MGKAKEEKKEQEKGISSAQSNESNSTISGARGGSLRHGLVDAATFPVSAGEGVPVRSC